MSGLIVILKSLIIVLLVKQTKTGRSETQADNTVNSQQVRMRLFWFLPAREMSEPAGSSSQLAWPPPLCYGKHGGPDVELCCSPGCYGNHTGVINS